MEEKRYDLKLHLSPRMKTNSFHRRYPTSNGEEISIRAVPDDLQKSEGFQIFLQAVC